jgi:hypothetical protein
MAATFKLREEMQTPSGPVAAELSVSGGAVAQIESEAISAGTDTLVNIAFPYANVKAYILLSTTAATVETNSTTAVGGDTITLAAGVPKTYILGGAHTSEFTANVTKFYVTNVADTVLTVKVLYDPTP